MTIGLFLHLILGNRMLCIDMLRIKNKNVVLGVI